MLISDLVTLNNNYNNNSIISINNNNKYIYKKTLF